MNRYRALLIIILIALVSAFTVTGQQVRDHKKGDDQDVLVVPKGARIQTDIAKSFPDTPATPFEYNGKVEIPVRLGFTTAIDAGSVVRVRIDATYADNGYQCAARLVAVAIDGKTYRLRTDMLPIDPSTAKEVTFTLLDDVTIER
jgi:hypothetical protein